MPEKVPTEQSSSEEALGTCRRARATPMAFTGSRCRPVENRGWAESPAGAPRARGTWLCWLHGRRGED